MTQTQHSGINRRDYLKGVVATGALVGFGIPAMSRVGAAVTNGGYTQAAGQRFYSVTPGTGAAFRDASEQHLIIYTTGGYVERALRVVDDDGQNVLLQTPSLAYNPVDGDLYGTAINVNGAGGVSGRGWAYRLALSDVDLSDSTVEVELLARRGGFKRVFGSAFGPTGEWRGINVRTDEFVDLGDGSVGNPYGSYSVVAPLGNLYTEGPGGLTDTGVPADARHAGLAYDYGRDEFVGLLGNFTDGSADDFIELRYDGVNGLTTILVEEDVFDYQGANVCFEYDPCEELYYGVRNKDKFVVYDGVTKTDIAWSFAGGVPIDEDDLSFDNMASNFEGECECVECVTEFYSITPSTGKGLETSGVDQHLIKYDTDGNVIQEWKLVPKNFEGLLRTPSLAYNPDADAFYGVAINDLTMIGGTGMSGKGWVYTMAKPGAGDTTVDVYLVGEPNGRLKKMFGTAFDPDGNWFGVNTGDDTFYVIDPNTGGTTSLGAISTYFPDLNAVHAGASYDAAKSDDDGSAFTLLLGNVDNTSSQFDDALDVKVDFDTDTIVSSSLAGSDVFAFDGKLVAMELDLCDGDMIYAVRNGDTLVTSPFPVTGGSEINVGVTLVGTDATIRLDNMTGVAVERECDECVPCRSEEELVRYEWEDGTFVIEGDADPNIRLLDGSTSEKACFETDYCELYVVNKGGTAYEVVEVTDGRFCVEELPKAGNNDRGRGGAETSAISFVAFYCVDPVENEIRIPGTQNAERIERD